MSRVFRLGLFIVAALLIFGAGVFLIGSKQLRFRRTYQLKALLPNVGGMQQGAGVRLGGTHQGTVKRIDLPPHRDGQIVVVMDMDPKTRAIVNQGSVASVKAEGLLGDKYVEISFGEKNAPAVKDGDTIKSEPPLDIADLIKKADGILDTTGAALESVEGTARNLQSVTARINEGKGTVGALINDRTMYQQAAAGATAFQENMEAMKHNFLLRGFFKKRGYEDAAELEKHQIAARPSGPALGNFVLEASKIFVKEDSAKLRNEKSIDAAGRFLESNRFGLAVVAASTGDKGDSDKSRTLSEARAMVVRSYLVDHFRLDDTRIKTLALGKTGQPGDIAKVEITAYPAKPSTAASAKRN